MRDARDAHHVVDPGGVVAVLGQRRHGGRQQLGAGGPTLPAQVCGRRAQARPAPCGISSSSLGLRPRRAPRTVGRPDARRRRPRGRRAVGRCYLSGRAGRVVPQLRRSRPALRRGRRRPARPSASSRAMSSRSPSPTSPDHVVAYAACAKIGAICAGVNPRLTDRERDAVLERAATDSSSSEPSWSGDGPDTVLAPLRVAGAAPPPLPPRPRPRRRHRLHLGHHGPAEGCACSRTANSRSSPRSTRACAGAEAAPPWARPRWPTSARPPSCPAPSCAAGRTFLVDRWRAGDALRHDRRAPHGVARRHPHPGGADAAPPRLRLDRPVARAGGRDRRRSGVTRAGGRDPRAARRARGRALLVHRGGHRPRHRVRRSTRGRRGVGRPSPPRRRALAARPRRRATRSPTARSARCACAPRP